MYEKELDELWKEGTQLLQDIGPYIIQGEGLTNYGNAIRVLDLLEKFESVKDKYKALLKEIKVTESTDEIYVPNFRRIEEQVKNLKERADAIRLGYC